MYNLFTLSIMNFKQIANGIKHISANDSRLGSIIAQCGNFPLRPHKKYFISLLKAIVGQQLSMKAAASINKKFLLHFNNKPTAHDILNSENLLLRNLGLSNSKVKYVKDLSQKIIESEIVLDGLSKKSDAEIIAELSKVKGIGVWTAHMFLIFTLCRLDVLPVGDLGIKKAVMLLYKLKEMPDDEKIIAISKKYKWSPYNSIASWYLWRSLEM